MITEGAPNPLGSLRLSRVGRMAASCALGIQIRQYQLFTQRYTPQ